MVAKSICLIAAALTATAGVRESAEKTLGLIEKTGAEWKVPCASCHHQGLGLMALDAARRHGLRVDEPAAQAHVERTIKPLLQSVDGILPMPIDAIAVGYTMAAASTAGIAPNLVTSVAARKFVNAQLPDGHWIAADARPPMSSSDFTATALALKAISTYLPVDPSEPLAQGRQWLATATPKSTEDRAFQLLGLVWAGAPIADRRHAAARLLATQRKDGGWAQEDGMESDAYATGQALYALRQAHACVAWGAPFQRGLRYLLDTQQPDGSWLVKSRLHSPAPISPPFFDAGFPHGRDQFLSFAGSAWAFLALTEALPTVANPVRPEPPAGAEPKDARPWMHTALFGSLESFDALADASMLPYVLPDVAKTARLLERGAKPGDRELAIAVSYRGSARVVRLLMAHGAKPTPNTLLSAVVAGDRETVRLILDAGIGACRHPELEDSPLAAAVLSNNADLIPLLVEHGADLNDRNRDGMTPLMSAALFHRTDAVRVLLELGADPNLTDKFGYTAQRHAEDIR
jgi:N-acyl-D-amino-acid deacylase